jgi:hypothetical protein
MQKSLQLPFALKRNGQGKFKDRILADHADKRDGPFQCPECSNEVVWRKCTTKRSHFAHKAQQDVTLGCSAKESFQHQYAKLLIAVYFRQVQLQPHCAMCTTTIDSSHPLMDMSDAKVRAEIEYPVVVHGRDYRPDVALVVDTNGKTSVVAVCEIKYTHAMEQRKIDDMHVLAGQRVYEMDATAIIRYFEKRKQTEKKVVTDSNSETDTDSDDADGEEQIAILYQTRAGSTPYPQRGVCTSCTKKWARKCMQDGRWRWYKDMSPIASDPNDTEYQHYVRFACRSCIRECPGCHERNTTDKMLKQLSMCGDCFNKLYGKCMDTHCGKMILRSEAVKVFDCIDDIGEIKSEFLCKSHIQVCERCGDKVPRDWILSKAEGCRRCLSYQHRCAQHGLWMSMEMLLPILTSRDTKSGDDAFACRSCLRECPKCHQHNTIENVLQKYSMCAKCCRLRIQCTEKSCNKWLARSEVWSYSWMDGNEQISSRVCVNHITKCERCKEYVPNACLIDKSKGCQKCHLLQYCCVCHTLLSHDLPKISVLCRRCLTASTEMEPFELPSVAAAKKEEKVSTQATDSVRHTSRKRKRTLWTKEREEQLQQWYALTHPESTEARAVKRPCSTSMLDA